MNRAVLIAVLAALVAVGGFYKFALGPKRAEAAKIQQDIAAKQEELDSARKLLASNQQARDSYRRAYATVVRLGKAVPADDDVRSLVVQLDAAARRTDVDFRAIEATGTGSAPASNTPAGAAQLAAGPLPPGATVGPAGFPVMPFSFAFTGSFFKLGDFFERLERFVSSSEQRLSVTGRLLTIDSLQLEPDAAGFPRIRAKVGATSYLVSPLEGMTAGATSGGPAGGGTAAGGSGTAPAPGGSSGPAPTTATSTGVIR
ncbi:MAG TPA: hypothetical protein VM266_03890 [Solirubrobacteraceae bacterium]|nr:hypothetical protein [Solirubrobacteraceae bacterium]